MPNRLAQETSPYLQQHADNPVDWYPWGEEALTLARRADRPILLSIGYSACHWCHVMAHESFEDPEVAARMNRHFVNIKVDREERPDLDQIYQTAHQLLAQRPGGWPLTMFLAPDGAPFFGGTYFPKQSRYGLPGFADLLERVANLYRVRRSEIERQNGSLIEALDGAIAAVPAGPEELSEEPLAKAVELASASFDPRHGGFGAAPKFPHPADLGWLLRRSTGPADPGADMVLATLRHMAEGGIYDQLGGGFCRYSVDERWEIPHFEKMLYDNGPLLALYADAWQVTGSPLFRKTAEATAAWVLREMQSPEGGYYSSLDADSEHEEGKFYVWSADEARARLPPEEFAVAEAHYGLDQPPNFEGRWHLRIAQPLEAVAARLGKPLEDCERLLTSAREKLFAVRAQRVRPGRDEKILTAWNALMIEGMAHAARVFDRPDWLASARRALDFVTREMWRDGRLLVTWKQGRAHLNAYLDDHAFLLAALLEVIQADFRAVDLDFARRLADVLLERFEDQESGGFFFTSHDHERLIHRPKTGHDSAIPSGNGVAAFALQRLGHLLGETRYLEAARRTLRLYYPQLAHTPAGHATLLAALEEELVPPTLVILRGPDEPVRDWQRRLGRRYLPRVLVLALPGEARGLPPALEKPDTGSVNAWVCCGVKCLEPIADFACLERVCKTAELI